MRVFWIRIISFSILWLYEISFNSTFQAVSIIAFAVTLGIYFLLTIPRFLIWKYTALLIILTAHGYFFTEEAIATALFLLYIVLDAAFRLKRQNQIVLFIQAGLLLLLLGLPDKLTVERVVLYLFVGILSFIVNQMCVERREQQEIYEELLGEYRIMKRFHINAENNARLEERTRIARDLHDSVGHRLTALIMSLEMLSIQQKDTAYDELKQLAKESLEDTRLAVRALQTEESEGIATVIHLIRKLEAESHLLVQFTLNQGVLSAPITNEISVVLYRVIQEALTNIMRHSDKKNAHIMLSRTATGDILFEITNPIQGRKPFTIGFGLKNMQERVEEINGSLKVYQANDLFIVSGKLTKGESK